MDLTPGLGPLLTRFSWGSPPLIVRDAIVIGASLPDQDRPVRKEGAPGDVRGYDVRTGRHLWTFHVIPREGEPGVETWEDGSWAYTGGANVWPPMSADEELGYVYLPTTSPTSDPYGGQAFAYVFDRVTGQPVWPIEERPVPQSTVPGERTAATQPFPTKPPPFDRQGISMDDLIDFTPELRAEAIEIVKPFVLGPLYTPPTVRGGGPTDTKGTIVVPGLVGGANCPGAALDPETGMLHVPSMTNPVIADLVKGDPAATNLHYATGPSGWGRSRAW